LGPEGLEGVERDKALNELKADLKHMTNLQEEAEDENLFQGRYSTNLKNRI
jgi:hypothetical protein